MRDFRKMSDEQLDEYINSFPSSHDIHGAIFEYDRRTKQRAEKIGGSRHKHTLGWTIVGAIAALIAAIAALWMLLR
jgi:NADH:ubiquinone oxidoreductase subunit D